MLKSLGALFLVALAVSPAHGQQVSLGDLITTQQHEFFYADQFARAQLMLNEKDREIARLHQLCGDKCSPPAPPKPAAAQTEGPTAGPPSKPIPAKPSNHP